jgi:hypothetical protein
MTRWAGDSATTTANPINPSISPRGKAMTSENKNDAELLALANEKGKFAIQIGFPMSEPLQEAFERGIDNEWFTLVDVSTIAHSGGACCRVFRLTEAGRQRRHALLPWIVEATQ